MRIPKEGHPIRSVSDLLVFEEMSLLDLGMKHHFSDKDVGALMVAFRIYACAYHELVLTGRMPAFNYDRLCEKTGLDEQALREAKMIIAEMDVRSGLVKENDKGGYEYDPSKFRKGR